MPPEITVPSELLPAGAAGVRLHVCVGLQVRLQVTSLVELLPTGGTPVLESLKYLIETIIATKKPVHSNLSQKLSHLKELLQLSYWLNKKRLFRNFGFSFRPIP